MLADGWVEDEARRAEYYRRILKESARLELLVERVLEKGRLQRETATPEPGDLAALAASLEPSLRMLAPDGIDDLRFELAPDLPPAMLTTEGVRSIVSNLVENARKYAPVAPGGEPIVVRVAREGREALVEVLDRGPGVPDKERERIFEAFYRMGKEQERRAKGTGLGLHLVALHARSMGGRAEVRPRPGGGAAFRVLLPFA
jgi:two-component system OmpR family sensor kinase